MKTSFPRTFIIFTFLSFTSLFGQNNDNYFAYSGGINFLNGGESLRFNLFSKEMGGFTADQTTIYELAYDYNTENDLGWFRKGDSANGLYISYFEINTKKDPNKQNICRPVIALKIINLTDETITNDEFKIPYSGTCGDNDMYSSWGGVCNSLDDENSWQKWVFKNNYFLTDNTPGKYRLEVKFELFGNRNGIDGCDEVLETIDNNGESFIFYFEILSESQEIPDQTLTIAQQNPDGQLFLMNPIGNTINIDNQFLNNDSSINFYNLAGNLVHSIYNPTSKELDVAHLPNGMYIVHTKINGETIVTKLVKE